MATRKWVATDGSQFDTKPEVEAYEAKQPFVAYLETTLGGDVTKAAMIYDYFDKYFRVPVVRQHKPKPAPAPFAPLTPKAGKGKQV